MARGLNQAYFTNIQFINIILSLFQRIDVLLEEKNELKKPFEVAIGLLCKSHADSTKILQKDDSILMKEILKFLNDNLGIKNDSYVYLLETVNSFDQCMVVIYAIFGCYPDHLGVKSTEILLLDTRNFEEIDKIINAKISLLTKILNMTPQEKNKESLNIIKMSLILGFIAHTNELSRLAIEEVESDREDKISPGLRKIMGSSVNGIVEMLKLYAKKDFSLVEESSLFPSDALSIVLRSLGYRFKSTGTISCRFISQLTGLLTNLDALLAKNFCKDSIPKLKAENSESDFLVKLAKTICDEGFEEQIDKLKEVIKKLRERIKSLENTAREKGENLSLQEVGEIQASKRGLVEGCNFTSIKSIANGLKSNNSRETIEKVAESKQDMYLFAVNSNYTENKESNSIATESVVNKSQDYLILKRISKIAMNTTLSFEEKISELQEILTGSGLLEECLKREEKRYVEFWFLCEQKFQELYSKTISDFKKEKAGNNPTRLLEDTEETSIHQLLKEEETRLSKLLEEKETRFGELSKFRDEKSRMEEVELFTDMQSINIRIIKIQDFKSHFLSPEVSGSCTELLMKFLENSSLLSLLRRDDVADFVANNNRKVEAILFLENLLNNLVSSAEDMVSVKAYQSIERSLRDVKSMEDLQLVNFTRSIISSVSFNKSSESKSSKLKLVYSIIDAFERIMFLEVKSLFKNFPVPIHVINAIASKLVEGFDQKDEHENYEKILGFMRKIKYDNPSILSFIEDPGLFRKTKAVLSIISELNEVDKPFANEYRKASEEVASFSYEINRFLEMREKKFPSFVLSLRKDFHSTLSNFLNSVQPSKEVIKMSFDDPVKRSVIPLKDNQLEGIYKKFICKLPLDFSKSMPRGILSESIELSEELVNLIKNYLGSEVIDIFFRILPKDFLNKSLNLVLKKTRLRPDVKKEDIKEYISYEISKKVFLCLVFKKILEKKTSEREFYKKCIHVGDTFDSLSKCLREYGIDFSSNDLREICRQFVRNGDECSIFSEENKLRKSVVKAIQNRYIDEIIPGTSSEVSVKHIVREYCKDIDNREHLDEKIELIIIWYYLRKKLKTDVTICSIERNKDSISLVDCLEAEITEKSLRRLLIPKYRERVLVDEEVLVWNPYDATNAYILVVGGKKFSAICLPNSIIELSTQLYNKECSARTTP